MMILAVDLGNYNVKTSEEIIFSSRFIKENEEVPIGEETIEYDGNFYTIGKGEFENVFNKSKKNYIPNLLYAIAKSVPVKEKNIDLVLGVPLDNLNIKEKFKEDLKGKTFKFKVNGKDREVTIERLATIGEGLSSYYALPKADMKKDIIIFDIGGRTTNIVTFIDGKLEKKFTVSTGVIDLYDNIKTKVNLKEGQNFKVEEIERLIKNEIITDIEDDKLDILTKIFNSAELKVKKETYVNYFTGGGSIVLQDTISSLVPKAKFFDNPLFSNVIGNKKVALVKWGE